MESWPSTIAQACVLSIAGCCLCYLTHACHSQVPAKVVQVATPICAQIARVYDRPDVEKACLEGGDFARVLTDLLGENAQLRAKTRQSLGDAGIEGGPINDR